MGKINPNSIILLVEKNPHKDTWEKSSVKNNSEMYDLIEKIRNTHLSAYSISLKTSHRLKQNLPSHLRMSLEKEASIPFIDCFILKWHEIDLAKKIKQFARIDREILLYHISKEEIKMLRTELWVKLKTEEEEEEEEQKITT